MGGKLGGRDAEVVVADDEGKPDVAVGKVKAFVDRDKVEFVVGPVFSNVLGAIMKPVTEANVILISPNAGSSAFAGKGCNQNFFVTSYENNQVHQVSGEYAKETGIKKVIIIVANYQAGKDAAAGFKSKFSGEVSTKSMCRSANSTTRPRHPRSLRQAPKRFTPSFRAAWA